MIIFFNSFDLFQGLFIISLGCDGFQHGSITGFIKAEVKINPKSIQIAVISENSQSGVIQSIKMICLKSHEIYLNRLPEIIIFDIHCLVLIYIVCNIFIE